MDPRSVEQVIRQELIPEIRREALNAYRGESCWPPKLNIIKSEEELREATECREFPRGLDFSTSPEMNARNVLYDMRDELQDQGVYFIGERRVGVKFTIIPPRGMQWRIGEFYERSAPIAQQIATWCGVEAARLESGVGEKFKRLASLFRDAEGTLRQIYTEADGLLNALPGVDLFGDGSSTNGDGRDDHRDTPEPTPAGVRPPPTF